MDLGDGVEAKIKLFQNMVMVALSMNSLCVCT